MASSQAAQKSADQGPPPGKRGRRPSEPGVATTPKYKKPRRRRLFGNGTEKPANYRSAIEALDKANAERHSFLTEVQEKQQNVERIQQELSKGKEELALAQAKLQEFEEDVVKAAKEDLIEIELALDLPWSRKYHQLVAFNETHGNLNIPTRCPEDKELDSLCIWVASQRARRRKAIEGRIKPDRPYQLELLERLGLEWTVRDNKWDEHIANLQKFKEHNGHCLVPQHYVDKKLAVWVGFIRQEMKVLKANAPNKYLNEERIDKLNQLGFVWNVFDLKWKQMFDKLKEFRETVGHCSVPISYPQNQELSNWVKKQRDHYEMYQDEEQRKNRKCKLTAEKVQQLVDLGFAWNTSDEATAAIMEDNPLLF